MFCPKCGRQMSDNSAFCPGCGNPVINNTNQFNNQNGYQQNNGYQPNYNQQTNYNQPNYSQPMNNQMNYNQSNYNQQMNYNQPNYNQPMNNQPKAKKTNTGVIVAIVLVAVLLVGGYFVSGLFGGGPKKERTVLVYMTGSDLESGGGHATTDLKSILDANVNLEDVNVLVIAGGSEKWNNSYISKDETSIYKLTANGFEKEKVIPLTNMGEASLLADFLTYGYENYKAKKYDFVLWNHGIGVVGTNEDKISGDVLSIAEFKAALEKSPFNSNNKFEYVNFIACLEGNYEYALILSDYADYYIGSEEALLVSSLFSRLDYLTAVANTDDPISINTKMIDDYFNKSLPAIEDYYAKYSKYLSSSEISSMKNQLKTQTYSIINLNKMKKLEKALESFISDIDLSKNYNAVAKVRSKLVAYGMEDNAYFSTVDLKLLVEGLKQFSQAKAEQVISAINEAIVYTRANNNYSRGLSIYFPYDNYQGESRYTVLNMTYRGQVYGNSNYHNFITQFYNIKNGGTSKMAFESDTSTNISSIKANTEFGLYLSNEDLEIYTKANYRIFKKVEKGYMPVYISSNVELNEETGYLKINYNNRGLKINDEIKSIYLNETYRDKELVTYVIPVKLYDADGGSVEAKITYNLDLKTNVGYISTVTTASKIKGDVVVPGISIIDLKDYKEIEFVTSAYDIADTEGKYSSNWKLLNEDSIKVNLENFNIELVDLSDNDNYVAVVEVLDTHDMGHYTNIIEIEN